MTNDTTDTYSARARGSGPGVGGAGSRRLFTATMTLVAVLACGPQTSQPTQPSKPTEAAKPGVPPGPAQPTATTAAVAKPTEPAKPAGNVDNGRQLVTTQGCIACHTMSGVQGAVGTLGPNLTGVATRAGSRVPGLSAEAYLRQSLIEPNAFVVPDFQPGVMPALQLDDTQLNDLVAFLLTLT